MRRINLILLLLGLLLVVGIVGAQEEELILYVLLSCDCESDAFLHEIMVQLEESLNEFNVSLSISSTFQEQEFYMDLPITLYISSGSDYNESPEGDVYFTEYQISYRVDSSLIDRQLGQLSPLLNGDMSFSFSIPIDDNCITSLNECEYFIDILTAMSLYSLNKCDLIAVFPQILDRQNVSTMYELENLQANCAILNGDYAHAQELLETIELFRLWFPEQEVVKLAWLYIQNENPEQAISLMTQNVDYRREEIAVTGFLPSYLIEALRNRAQIYALAFDYDSGIADMDEAIALAEENEVDNATLAELYTIRGQIVFLLYEWDRVLADFNHAIELDPNYAPAYFQRGVLYYTMTQRENALADFEHYLELEPDGLYAEEAAQYIESIQTELEALGD